MELIFQEDNFLVKTIETHEELDAALRLRHVIFREELKWVPPTFDGRDLDPYDDFAESLIIYDDRGELIGNVRMILDPDPFMIDKEFACLLPEDGSFARTPRMTEITRICVKEECRKMTAGGLSLAHLLYKGVYHWSLANDSRHLVAVIEQRYFHYLKRYFPFRAVGEFIPLGDGVMSGMAVLDWREFEEIMPAKRPEFFAWMTNMPALVPSRALRHALY